MSLLDYLRIPERRESAPPAAPEHAEEQRVLSLNQETGALEGHGVDLLGQSRTTALSRRVQRSNAQVVTSHAAVFAAVRWREQAITRPQLVLLQSRGDEWDELGTMHDPRPHPALAALRRGTHASTVKQFIGGIERGKLTNGDHILVKRRDGLGTVREFEVWDGATAWAVARQDTPWIPAYFEHLDPRTGRTIQVGPEDVVWHRHIVDPRDPMRSLTPIGAVRVQVDTSLEAMRSMQRYFDQGIGAGGFVMPADEGGTLPPNEVERIRDELGSEWVGTDNQSRWHLLEANLKLLATPQTNRDLEWVQLQLWGVRDVARAFEVSPITLKDFEFATYTNADQATAQDWETIRNQLDATVEELNEFLIRPDFGEDFRLEARYAGISALQDTMKTAAEVDDIRLKGGYATINELRARDGKPRVPWGDVPIVPSNMMPLGALQATGTNQPPAGPSPQPSPVPGEGAGSDGEDDGMPPRFLRPMLDLVERGHREGWTQRRLKNEMRKMVLAGEAVA